MTPEKRLDELEKELKELKAKKKDRWDKMSAIGSILIPISVAVVGAIFSWQMKTAEIETGRQSKDAELVLSQRTQDAEAQARLTEQRIRTAEMVSHFFQQLLSKDEKESELAKEALLIGAPEDSPKLLRRLAELQPGAPVSKNVETLLDNRRDTLISRLFSESAELRLDAYNQLLSSWADDETMIPALISFARQHLDNENGIYNTLVLLSHMNRDVIKRRKDEILAFAAEAEKNGSRSKERADKLRSRLE